MAYWYNSSKPIVMRKHFEPLKSVFACYVAIINYCILAQIVFFVIKRLFSYDLFFICNQELFWNRLLFTSEIPETFLWEGKRER